MRAVIVAVILVLAGSARADESAPPTSEDTAFWLSAGGTLGAGALIGLGAALNAARGRDSSSNVGSALLTAGAFGLGLAPSFGEWYAHDYFTIGMGLRLVGMVVAGAGALDNRCIDAADLDCSHPGGGNDVLIAGVAIYGAGAIYDLATARRAARAYNREHAVIVPVALHGPGGLVPGAAVSVTF